VANYNLGEARGKIVLETDFQNLADAQKALEGFKGRAEEGALSQQEAWRKTGTAATVAGAAVVAGFGVAVAAASDFEFQMSAVQAVSGATADEMDLIREAALRIGKDTSFSASEAALAMEELVKAGISTEDVLNGAADATVALAAAGGVDLPTAATIAANAMNQFQLGAEDLVGVTDLIAGAANASAIDVNQFGYSLSQVGAVANLAGLSFDDTATAIAAMGNAGIVGSDAGTSLKAMLMNLQPSTEKQADLMRELGLVTEDGANQFYTAEGSLKSLAEISDVLGGALTGMTDAQKQATLEILFGSDAIRGAAVIAEQGSAGINALNESMLATSAADVAATRLDNMKGSTEQLLGSLETLWISIGSQLIPMIRDMVDGITGAVNWFQSLDSGMQNAIVAATGIAGALLLFFGITIKVIQGMQQARAAILAITGATGLFTAAQTAAGAAQGRSLVQMVAGTAAMVAQKAAMVAGAVATGVATAAQWALNAAMTANPIGIIIAAIAALVAGLIWFFTQTELGRTMWSNFMTFLQEAWTNIASFFSTVWNGIVEVATTVWNGIMTVIGAVVDWFQTYVWPVIQFVIDMIVAYFTMYYNIVMFVWNGILAVVGAVVAWFVAYVWPAIEAVINFIVALFNFFWGVVQLVWNAIWSTISAVVGQIIGFLVDVWNNFLAGWNIIWTAISDVVTTIWNAIVAFLTPIVMAIWNTIMTVFNNVRNFINDVMNNVRNGISIAWNAISTVVSTVVNAVWGFISGVWGNIVGFVTTTFNNVKNAIMTPLQDALNFIGGIKDTIIGFFAGAGDWLFNAGKNIIQGFLNGLQNMLGGITDFFNGLTNMIPEIKGPPEKDKVLLTDNGKLIMQSLINGLDSETRDLYNMLNGLNATIPAELNSSVMASVNNGNGVRPIQINVEWHAGDNDGVSTRQQVLDMLGHASELVREELD
jgi:TP901 family phage tail tape measure protein